MVSDMPFQECFFLNYKFINLSTYSDTNIIPLLIMQRKSPCNSTLILFQHNACIPSRWHYVTFSFLLYLACHTYLKISFGHLKIHKALPILKYRGLHLTAVEVVYNTQQKEFPFAK